MKNKRTGLESKIILDDVFPITPRYFFTVFYDFINDRALLPEDFSRWKIEKGTTRHVDSNFATGHGQWLLRKLHYLPGVFVAEIIVTQISNNSSKILIDIPGNEVNVTSIFEDVKTSPTITPKEFDLVDKNLKKVMALNLQENYEATLLLRKFVIYLKRKYQGSIEKLDVSDFMIEEPNKEKTGPETYCEDVWAWTQVVLLHKPRKEVYKIWVTLVKKNNDLGTRSLDESNYARTFYKITRKDWYKE